MLQLRDYQEKCVNAVMADIRCGKNPLVALPCGAGKTEVFFEVCKRFLSDRPNAPVCILLNRVLLLDQTIRRIEKIFPRELIGVVCGTRNKRVYAPITVATIGSVQKDKKFGLVIVDECHRTTLNNKESAYMQFLNNQPLILGVSATPWRFDGYIHGNESIWPKVTYTKPLIEMIAEGYLVKPIIRKSNEEFDLSGIKIEMGDYAQGELTARVEDKSKISKQVEDALLKASDRKHIVWVCVSIKHSEMVVEELQKKGESTAIVHSLMTNTEIENCKNSFESGHSRHIVSVSMLVEGLDVPCIDCVVMCRPTKSSSLWVQVAGRALRPALGKENALILDFGRVAENCGALDRPIIRKGGRKKEILQSSPPMKFCASCLSYIAAQARTCPDCGYEYPPPEPTRNLTAKSSDTDILSAPVEPKTIDVSSIVAINMHQGKKTKCVKITFYPKNLFARDIYDFAFSFNMVRKFKRIGIPNVYSIEDAEKYNGIKWDSGVQKIVVDYSGAYPEIVSVM